MGRPKRNILAAAEESITPPDELKPSQSVARVVKAEGKSLYVCELPSSFSAADVAKTPTVLVELAARFRNTIWIRNGGYVLVDLVSAADRKLGSKVEGEIVNVVRDEKSWRREKYWPAEFAKRVYDDGDSDEDDSNVGKLPPSDSEDD